MRATALLGVLLAAGIVALVPVLLERRAAGRAHVSFHPLTFGELGSPVFEIDHLSDRGGLALERFDLTVARDDCRRIIELGAGLPDGVALRNRVETAWERLRRVDAMLEDR